MICALGLRVALEAHLCAFTHIRTECRPPDIRRRRGAENVGAVLTSLTIGPPYPPLLAQMHFRDNGNKDNENWVKNADRSFVVGGFTMTEPLGHVLC